MLAMISPLSALGGFGARLHRALLLRSRLSASSIAAAMRSVSPSDGPRFLGERPRRGEELGDRKGEHAGEQPTNAVRPSRR